MHRPPPTDVHGVLCGMRSFSAWTYLVLDKPDEYCPFVFPLLPYPISSSQPHVHCTTIAHFTLSPHSLLTPGSQLYITATGHQLCFIWMQGTEVGGASYLFFTTDLYECLKVNCILFEQKTELIFISYIHVYTHHMSR